MQFSWKGYLKVFLFIDAWEYLLWFLNLAMLSFLAEYVSILVAALLSLLNYHHELRGCKYAQKLFAFLLNVKGSAFITRKIYIKSTLEFCKRPTFFDFGLNLKRSKINRAASKSRRLFMVAGDHLPKNGHDLPPLPGFLWRWTLPRPHTQGLEGKSVLGAHRQPVCGFSVSVSESEGKGKEKLIRMK